MLNESHTYFCINLQETTLIFNQFAILSHFKCMGIIKILWIKSLVRHDLFDYNFLLILLSRSLQVHQNN